MKILILGQNGMLGHMVYKYYLHNGVDLNLETIAYRWPTTKFKETILKNQNDYLINCIGYIPQKNPSFEDLFSINVSLPIWLSRNFKGKILHPTTDCEFSGNLEAGKLYKKTDIKDATDDYGLSKLVSSTFLEKCENVKQFRVSIIGPELKDKVSLMEWFFKQTDVVSGYVNHYWNGITTLEWAKQSLKIINGWDKYDNIIQASTYQISKRGLLEVINDVFKTKKDIITINTKTVNKCLENDGQLKDIPSIEKQLQELKSFYYN
jgi:dTDP-4-dehydrorhamnose reductase